MRGVPFCFVVFFGWGVFRGVLVCSGVPGNNTCPKAWLFESQLMLIDPN